MSYLVTKHTILFRLILTYAYAHIYDNNKFLLNKILCVGKMTATKKKLV